LPHNAQTRRAVAAVRQLRNGGFARDIVSVGELSSSGIGLGFQRGIVRCASWLLPEFGRGYYAPLRQYEGGAAGRRLPEKKPQTWMFAVFFTFQPTATAVGCPSPFEPLKDGFATGTRPLGL